MKRNILYLLLPLLLFASCGGEDDGLSPGAGEQSGGQIKFEMGFAGQNGLRVSTGTDFKSTWETGDEIGVFACKAGTSLLASGNPIHNLKITYNGSVWSAESPVFWPNDENRNENLDFYAYYPYNAAVTNPLNYTFSIKTDQTGGNYNQSDLLLATATNQVKGAPVYLQFSHALSLVQVQVKAEVVVAGKRLKREVNMPYFDEDFKVSLTGVKPNATLGWTAALTATGQATGIVMHKVAGQDYTYRALVPAQTLPADSKVTFEKTTPGNTMEMNYQGVKNVALNAGNACKYSIALSWIVNPGLVYAVGDAYPHAGPAIGIVYEVSNGGKNGKVVDLDETSVWWSLERDFTTGATDMDNGLNNMKTIKGLDNTFSGYPAFTWVHDKNSASEAYSDANAKGVWYLPAKNELISLFTVYNNAKETFNAKLTGAGGTVLSNTRCWSSSEDGSMSTWYWYDDGKKIDYAGKRNPLNVRCVFAF